MKKSILGLVLGLMLGLLLIGSNGFAADGDLIVNGNLGVGTTTPTEKLDVKGNVKANGFVGPGIIRQIQTVSPTSDISTTSTTFADMPGMEITLTTGDSILLIIWNASINGSSNGNWVVVETQVDGTRSGHVFGGAFSSELQGIVDAYGGHNVATVAAGTHSVKLRWKVGSGAAYNYPGSYPDFYGRTLTVIEVGQ